MSLRNLITKYGQVYVVTRAAAGAYTAGRLVAGAITTASMMAVIQPVSGRLLEALPEGQSADDTRVVYTQYALRTRTPAGAPDRVTIAGEYYAVYQVELWEKLSGTPHYRAFVVRQTDGSAPI